MNTFRELSAEEIESVAGGGLVGDLYARGMEALDGVGINIPPVATPLVTGIDNAVEYTVDTVSGVVGETTDFLGQVISW
ncbi:hypothetical protein [Serratia sp. 1D1416]|uniref:hypothetical protein n=1 Tax=Serratia sp. 1D1416 TaxID=2447890 RepID=UPI001013C5CA|nr:hypothetical protein [Serratia sp. 1D1416]